MPPRVTTPLVEVFLLVEQPRQRLSHWSQAMAPLDGAAAPALVSVDAYYDPAANQAIFGLRYDEHALGVSGMSYIVEVALLAEIGMIQAAELSDGDRRRFVVDRLAGCTVHVADQRKVVAALVELVRRLRGQKPSTSPPASSPEDRRERSAPSERRSREDQEDRRERSAPSERRSREDEEDRRERSAPSERRSREDQEDRRERSAPSERRSREDQDDRRERVALEATLLPRAKPAIAPPVRARVETGESLLVVAARGTRNRPGAESGPRSSRDLALGSVRQSQAELAELDRDAALATPASGTSPLLARDVAEAETSPARRAQTAPPRPGETPRPSPNIITRSGVHRANTVMMTSDEARRMLEAANRPIDVEGPTERAPVAMQPPEQADEPPTEPAPPPIGPRTISARYLRSGRWVPLRIGSLSLKGAALMAVALPRVDDRVDVALAYAGHRALVRGAVAKVSTMREAETSGATMFSVNFELDPGSRRQLTALLTAARAANVTIKPAPPRGTRRYPVEWPVCLGTTRGAVRAEALDVSADGMFVKPVHALTLDAHVTFSAVLDDNQPPVSGHARVVRNISEAEAHSAGLLSGYGLVILEMVEAERERWSGFLSRVARRASKRVLIAASAARLTELETGLVAGGYATTGGTEPGAIAQLVSAEARPVDAALIDAAWLVSEGSTLWVQSVFSARNVPYVTVHGDAKRARMAIDRLLAVV